MKVFLDANILFSAASGSSATHQLLSTILQHVKVLTNHHAVEEAQRNLRRKLPGNLSGLNAILAKIEISKAFRTISDIVLPECDQPIIAGAVGAHATHLWTGDKAHFGKYYGIAVHGVLIVSSVLLVRECIEKGWI